MTSGTPPSCPFSAGSRIEDLRFFVGRREELDFIASHMTADQPTSINVVGERRIGKSSLLYHFFQTYEQRVQRYGKNARDYVVICLSLQEAHCQQETSFYQAVAQELLNHIPRQVSWGRKRVLNNALKVSPLNRQTFSQAIKQWKVEKVLPVLCLDKIEGLFEYSQEFNNGFYDNLRSLMDDNALMLVVASYQRLDVYSRQHKLTSSFFNLGHVLPLRGLTEAEALNLVRLPEKNVLGTPAALTPERQKLAQSWGGRHPYLLQLAGLYLWEAQTRNRSDDWGKAQFDEQAQRLPRRRFELQRIGRGFHWVILNVFKVPIRLISLAERIGNVVGKVIAWGVGITFILLIILAIFGDIPWIEIPEQFREFLCSTLSSVLGKFCK
ncbi:MAG: AAA-like domain-containing protein [Xenococcaceae cyanobacterium]